MKVAVLFARILFLATGLLSVQTHAQDMPPRPGVPGESTVLINGRVVTEDNSPPPQSVTVVLDCVDRQPVEVNTSPGGNFSFSVRRTDSPKIDATQLQDIQRNESADLAACDLNAKLAGYSAEALHLSSQGRSTGVSDVGIITLHPNTHGQTFAVDVNSLAAPDKAKSAFEKGEEQKKKGKWAAAVESFRRAIAVYPRYALAWLELGRVQATQHDFVGAQQSFRESVNQDSKLVDGYLELAHLAVQQGQWQELLSATEHLVQVHPEVTEFWFLNAAANFNLGDIDKAEASITRGLRLDSAHKIPQLEYLYALVLARHENFQAAAEHTAAYLKLAPKASDALEAQKRLAQFQTLATTATAK